MMDTIAVMAVNKSAIYELQEIGRLTFAETFAVNNTAENMAKYLTEEFSLARLSEQIDNKDCVFFFARLGERVIGYLKLNFGESQTELKGTSAMEIERIYVLNEFHGKKVGQLLYQKAIDVASEMQMNYVWLGVWEENTRALNFYKKNGFVAFDQHIFMLGDDKQTDIMMKKVL